MSFQWLHDFGYYWFFVGSGISILTAMAAIVITIAAVFVYGVYLIYSD